MKLKNLILKTALFTLLFGCNDFYTIDKDTFETAEVISEKYEQPRLENKINEHLFSTTETTFIGDSKYLLKVRSNSPDSTIYNIDVQDSYSGGSKELLNEAVNVGDFVKFKTGRFSATKNGDTIYFSDFHNNFGRCCVGREIWKE